MCFSTVNVARSIRGPGGSTTRAFGVITVGCGRPVKRFFSKFFFTPPRREFFFALVFERSTIMRFQRFSTIRQIFFSFVGRLRVGSSRGVQRVKYPEGNALDTHRSGESREKWIDEIKISKQKKPFWRRAVIDVVYSTHSNTILSGATDERCTGKDILK